jgi:hypothetical protein
MTKDVSWSCFDHRLQPGSCLEMPNSGIGAKNRKLFHAVLALLYAVIPPPPAFHKIRCRPQCCPIGVRNGVA